MIQVIEMIAPDGTPIEGATCPPEIAACGKGAPAYLVIDPSKGNSQGRAMVEEEMRNAYKKGSCIVFMGNHKLPDGRVVSVGKKIDPLVAHWDMTRDEQLIVFGRGL